MNRARVDQWCEKGILGLVLALLIYSPLAFGAVRPNDLPIMQWLTIGAVLLWIIRLWLGEAREIFWPSICWVVTAFTVYAVFRYRHSEIEYLARWDLIRILCYAFLFLVVVNNLGRQETARIIVAALLMLAAGLTFYAAYQYFTGSMKVWGLEKQIEFRFRGSATYVCPNHLAGLLEMILPLGLAYTFMGRMSHAGKVLAGYASLMALAGIGVTVSRGGWIATGLALVFFFVVMVRMREYRFPAIVALALLAITSLIFILNADLSHFRFQAMFASGKIEDVRFDYFGPAVKVWLDHFWFGGGPGHFAVLFLQYRPEIVVNLPNFVHNDYLNVLADWGLVGEVIFLTGWILVGIGAWRTWRQLRLGANELAARPSSRSALVLGASVGLMAILLHAFTDFNFYIPANAMVAVTLAALLTGHLRYLSSRYLFKARLAFRAPLTLALLAAVIWSAQQAVLRYRENQAIDVAARAPIDSPKMVEALEQAHAIDPTNPEITWHLGESFRRRSWALPDDYKALAVESLTWFQRSIALNPHDAWSYIGAGMCLDWLDRFGEADKYFEEALKHDPNGFYTIARVGWHYSQKGEFETARKYLERSLRILIPGNDYAAQNLEAVMHRLHDQGK